MRMIDDRTGLDVLDRQECLELLGARHLGRIGVVIGGRPLIMPVNYVMEGEAIVFRTDEGTKLAAAAREAFVAFEIDDTDPWYREGWSVLAVGMAREITDAVELDRVRRLPLRPWAKGDKSHWVRIGPITVTGRRIVNTAG